MLLALTMPQFGESITQARIVHWLKKEGETVKEGEPLIEMETEKAVFSYESPFSGELAKILEGDDAEAPVGKEIGQFEVSDTDGKKYLSLGVGREVAGTKTPPKSSGRGEPSIGVSRIDSSVSPSSARAPTEGKTQPSTGGKLSPLIRSLAKEKNIPLEEAETVSGTGPGGRVTKEDFENYLTKRRASAPTPSASQTSKPISQTQVRDGVKQTPVSPIRSRIADNMILSKKTIPHAACSVDVDLKLIETWRAGQSSKDKAPSYVVFAIVAVLKALKNHPLINSAWKEGPSSDARRWIETYDYVNMGIAVATDQGLMVPVMRNAHRLSFQDIVREMERLVEGGRKGALKVDDLTGATITVNNTGAVGAVRTQQIVPPGQGSIIAFNRVVKRPWAVGDKIEIRPIMGLDVAFDHRLIDGDHAGRFLVDVARHLENFDFSQIT